MRSYDKKIQIKKVNLLVEQRYLKEKGYFKDTLLSESDTVNSDMKK